MVRCHLSLTVLLALLATTAAHQSMRWPVEMAVRSLSAPVSESETLMGATEDCLEALTGGDAAPACLDELAAAPDNDALLVDMCAALHGDDRAYRCSRAQAEKALDTLEHRCGAELANGHPEATALYSRWYLYPLAADVVCSTDDDGDGDAGPLCHYGPRSESMLDANWECLRCIRKQVRLVDRWQPTRTAGPAAKAYDRWWFANNDLKHHCGMNGQ
ncbi:hypothetical protein SYNPS1DRAFT_27249 [Syncephalis pseudoplumigaleata]|uniref:Uncharacterized protein n=1 Tax=Syncephalis pseudoplumigaleata TaxID=1712513 RepID=A0A4P9Z3F9_9FUNG|nr:hypothetical protein SYNPS1DRAFT_27249 [Syncephalis pseudoplumigaleata]|eukprot:RKP27083.1 hypothetical protein SYNPS1DRAFT_27249 [Syncephalis pseudoplumigaleata]